MVYIFLKGVLSFAAMSLFPIRKFARLLWWLVEHKQREKFTVMVSTLFSSSSILFFFVCVSVAKVVCHLMQVGVAEQTGFAFLFGEREKK